MSRTLAQREALALTAFSKPSENQSMRRFVFLILLCAVVCGSFSNEAFARRRRHPRKKRQVIINEKKLYERLGGTKTIASIVDEWLRLDFSDQRVAPFFANITAKPEKIGRLRRDLNEQLCEMADGPCQYKGPEMNKVHAAMHVNEEQYLVVSNNLYRSLEKMNIPEREKDELLARVGETRSEIVEGAADPVVKKQ